MAIRKGIHLILENIFYARLSGAHPTLSLAELKAVGEIECKEFKLIKVVGFLAIFTCDFQSLHFLSNRLAFTKSLGLLIGISDDPLSYKDLVDKLTPKIKKLNINRVGISFERSKGVLKNLIKGENVIKDIIKILINHGIKIDMKNQFKLEVFLIEGIIAIGIRLYRINLREFEERRPRKRPFFKPGPLDPRLSRVLVNLSRLKRKEMFLDPFCGTGGMAIEACLIGSSKIFCGDIDPVMAKGSLKNILYYRCQPQTLVYVGDALDVPFKGLVSSIATDPPYGRSTSTKGRKVEKIYRKFLEKAMIVLDRNGYLVFAGPSRIRPEEIAQDVGLKIVEKHYMYVHSSLIRTIVVSRL